jgi:hypothetical protein
MVGVAGMGEGLGLAFAVGEGSLVTAWGGGVLIAVGWQATKRIENRRGKKRGSTIFPYDNKVTMGLQNKVGPAGKLPTQL